MYASIPSFNKYACINSQESVHWQRPRYPSVHRQGCALARVCIDKGVCIFVYNVGVQRWHPAMKNNKQKSTRMARQDPTTPLEAPLVCVCVGGGGGGGLRSVGFKVLVLAVGIDHCGRVLPDKNALGAAPDMRTE
jgi:hypothetical protein